MYCGVVPIDHYRSAVNAEKPTDVAVYQNTPVQGEYMYTSHSSITLLIQVLLCICTMLDLVWMPVFHFPQLGGASTSTGWHVGYWGSSCSRSLLVMELLSRTSSLPVRQLLPSESTKFFVTFMTSITFATMHMITLEWICVASSFVICISSSQNILFSACFPGNATSCHGDARVSSVWPGQQPKCPGTPLTLTTTHTHTHTHTHTYTHTCTLTHTHTRTLLLCSC